MKIATWNLDRPNGSLGAQEEKSEKIRETLRDIDADIFVLTETNLLIDPGPEYTPLSSNPLPAPGLMDYRYQYGENVTTIWSKYPLKRIKTRNANTSVCARVETPCGVLNIYGTLIGITGRTDSEFLSHLAEQVSDWQAFDKDEALCIVGDFNVTFSDKLYNHPEARQKISKCFESREITILTDTQEILNNVDQIAISNSFLNKCKLSIPLQVWNDPPNKRISDHKAISLNLDSPTNQGTA